MSTLKEIPPLPQGVAYGIVLGFGIIFAAFMNIVTWIARRYLQEPSVLRNGTSLAVYN